MAEQIINTKIKYPYDTEYNWSVSERILLEGEIALTSDNGKYKVGDGVHKWRELTYPNVTEIPAFSLAIVGSNLICYYPDEGVAPSIYIDDQGCLIWNME